MALYSWLSKCCDGTAVTEAAERTCTGVTVFLVPESADNTLSQFRCFAVTELYQLARNYCEYYNDYFIRDGESFFL